MKISIAKMPQVKENIFILLYHSVLLFPIVLERVALNLVSPKRITIKSQIINSTTPLHDTMAKISILPKDKLGIINV